MFSRHIKCDKCGLKGKIEAHDTLTRVEPYKIFKLQGKTSDGYLVFSCPNCKSEVVKSPYSFMFTGKIKTIGGLIVALGVVGYFKRWTIVDILVFPVVVGMFYFIYYFMALLTVKWFGIDNENGKQKKFAKVISLILTAICSVMAIVMA